MTGQQARVHRTQPKRDAGRGPQAYFGTSSSSTLDTTCGVGGRVGTLGRRGLERGGAHRAQLRGFPPAPVQSLSVRIARVYLELSGSPGTADNPQGGPAGRTPTGCLNYRTVGFGGSSFVPERCRRQVPLVRVPLFKEPEP